MGFLNLSQDLLGWDIFATLVFMCIKLYKKHLILFHELPCIILLQEVIQKLLKDPVIQQCRLKQDNDDTDLVTGSAAVSEKSVLSVSKTDRLTDGRTDKKHLIYPSTMCLVKVTLRIGAYTVPTSKEPVCPRVELIFKIIIILLIIFLGFIKSKPC